MSEKERIERENENRKGRRVRIKYEMCTMKKDKGEMMNEKERNKQSTKYDIKQQE